MQNKGSFLTSRGVPLQRQDQVTSRSDSTRPQRPLFVPFVLEFASFGGDPVLGEAHLSATTVAMDCNRNFDEYPPTKAAQEDGV